MDYIREFCKVIKKIELPILVYKNMIFHLNNLRATKGTLYLIGNGGSNAIASHAAVDLMNSFGIKVMPLTDSCIITQAANDYSWGNSFAHPLGKMFTNKDALIAISSSGESASVINAVSFAKSRETFVITFTGFKPNNRLKNLGDVNIWVDSEDYGIVETAHTLLLHMIGREDGLGCKQIK